MLGTEPRASYAECMLDHWASPSPSQNIDQMPVVQDNRQEASTAWTQMGTLLWWKKVCI